jgi:diketogulonate reductase-like aldo/keto reductase
MSVLLISAFMLHTAAALRQRRHTLEETSTAMKQPTVAVAGSAKAMPMLGFGTAHGDVFESTKTYLAMGGRHIDTAHLYRNQKHIARAIKESAVPREELWVTSKVWIPRADKYARELAAETAEDAEKYVDRALNELDLEYIDLMLLHAPSASTLNDVELWRGLIKAQKKTKVKSIGVSNYDISQIQALEEATGVRPAVNQFHYNPFSRQQTRDLVEWCKKHGVIVEAYGSVKDQGKDMAKVRAAAVKHNMNDAQYLLRWALNRGVVVIPGSAKPEHIKANLNVPEFETHELDMA